MPDWPAGTVCAPGDDRGGGPHAIPSFRRPPSARDDIIVLALARRAGRSSGPADPRVALTVVTGAPTSRSPRTAWPVVATRAPGGVVAVEIAVDAVHRHERPTFAIDAGVGGADRRRRRRRATTRSAALRRPAAPRLRAPVKLATFGPRWQRAARREVDGDRVVVADDGRRCRRLRSGDREPARGAAHPLAAVTLLAPHVPRAIFGIGLNWPAHAAEQGLDPPGAADRLHEAAVLVAPPGGPHRARAVAAPDYEGELAVVGPDGTVAGYAVADDVSARDLQRREPQWTRAKGSDGSARSARG